MGKKSSSKILIIKIIIEPTETWDLTSTADIVALHIKAQTKASSLL